MSGSGNGQFNTPTGVATDAAGDVYVMDYGNNRVQKFTSTGSYLIQWGSQGSGNGQFFYPYSLATDPTGNVYVSDNGNNRIQKFSGTGTPMTQWGSQGIGNGQFNNIFGVAADGAGDIFICDTGNNRIQKFTGTGTYITQWGSSGSGNGQFNAPVGVATDAAGDVYVADINNHRIQKFTGTGTYITQWGSPGSGNGQFSYPRGLASDAAGNVYVAEQGNNRIQKFTGTGTYITQWGSPGSGDGQFNNPWAVATDAAGDVYVADTSNHRIQKFGPAAANAQPVITAPATASATVGTSMPSLCATATDADAINTLTITYSSTPDLPLDLVFNTTSGLSPRQACITGTPRCAGTYTITWTVNDGSGAANATNSTTTILTISEAPPTHSSQCGAPAGLVGWWTFDDLPLDGLNAGDIAGGSHDGTLKGAVRVPGKVGCAAVNLAGGPVTVPRRDSDPPVPDLNIGVGAEFSFTAWFRMNSFANVKDTRFLAVKHSTDKNVPYKNAPASLRPGYDFSLSPTGNTFRVRFFSDFSESYSTSGEPISFDVRACGLDKGWHHFAVVITRGAGPCPGVPRGVSLYIDGAPVTGSPKPIQTPGTTILANNALFNIGASSPKCDGDIDEVMVFQRALTSPEVGQIYNDPDGSLASCPRPCGVHPACLGAPQQMVAWWPFDEPAGSTMAVDAAKETAANWNDVPNIDVASSGRPRLATWAQGKVGCGAVNVAGGPVQIISADELNIGIGAEFSFAAWFRMKSLFAAGSRRFLAIKHSTDTKIEARLRPGYDFSFSSTGNNFIVNLYSASYPGGEPIVFDLSACGLDQGWHHAAVVIARGACQGTLRGVSLYLDGAPVTPLPKPILTPSSQPLDNTQFFNIGANSPKYDEDIDEVMVFQRALTPSEVGAIYDAPNGFLASCPVVRGSTFCFVASGPRCVQSISGRAPESAPISPVDPGLRAEFGLRAVMPNPTHQSMRVNFSLIDARPAKIEVFNVSGRRVVAREVGSFGPGLHTIILGERTGLPSGVYLVRLTQGGKSQTARVVLVR